MKVEHRVVGEYEGDGVGERVGDEVVGESVGRGGASGTGVDDSCSAILLIGDPSIIVGAFVGCDVGAPDGAADGLADGGLSPSAAEAHTTAMQTILNL